MNKILNNKLTATLAAGGILSLIASGVFIVVALFHIEPYLSSDEKGESFLYYGGDYGMMLLLLGGVLLFFAIYRSRK